MWCDFYGEQVKEKNDFLMKIIMCDVPDRISLRSSSSLSCLLRCSVAVRVVFGWFHRYDPSSSESELSSFFSEIQSSLAKLVAVLRPAKYFLYKNISPSFIFIKSFYIDIWITSYTLIIPIYIIIIHTFINND